jgi:hypothetical protein
MYKAADDDAGTMIERIATRLSPKQAKGLKEELGIS